MADKRAARRNLRRLERVKTWQLLILFVLVCFVAATFLRINNVGMIQRRSAVATADKSGNETQIFNRLQDLQRYSTTHMNASSGVIYLQHQYERDSQAAIQRASAASSENARVHAQAEAVCHPQYSGWSMAYIQCFVNELSKYPTSDTIKDPELPNAELYRHEYTSPLWTPDFAGWSIVLAVVILVVIVLRLISLVILQLLLRYKYRAA